MLDVETQPRPEICHIGIQCELLLPPIMTSTPMKGSIAVPEPNVSDISDDNDDNEVADSTKSTIYQETTSASEPEPNLPVEEQQTYLHAYTDNMLFVIPIYSNKLHQSLRVLLYMEHQFLLI